MNVPQLSVSVAPVVVRLEYFGLGVIVVTAVSFVLARLVGKSRPARKALFFFSSVVGFLAVFLLISTLKL